LVLRLRRFGFGSSAAGGMIRVPVRGRGLGLS
jgi:hypothetical protein